MTCLGRVRLSQFNRGEARACYRRGAGRHAEARLAELDFRNRSPRRGSDATGAPPEVGGPAASPLPTPTRARLRRRVQLRIHTSSHEAAPLPPAVPELGLVPRRGKPRPTSCSICGACRAQERRRRTRPSGGGGEEPVGGGGEKPTKGERWRGK
jgi:hypothetical protein